MKIGETPIQLTTSTTLVVPMATGPVELLIGKLPLNYDAQRDELFPQPRRSRRFMQNAKGAVLRHPDSNEPLFEDDDSDPVANAAWYQYRDSVQLFMVFLALRGSVTFDCITSEEYEANPKTFAAKVAELGAEMEAAGFGAGHLVKIQQKALDAGGITDEMLSDARDSFS